MEHSRNFEDTVISSQIAEINSAISSQQYTLAAEALIDFVLSFTHANANFTEIRSSAVKLKGRVNRLQRSVQLNLPRPESVDSLETALLDLVTTAEAAAAMPESIRHKNLPKEKIEAKINERINEAEKLNRPVTAADLRLALIDLMNEQQGDHGTAVRLRNVEMSYPGGDFKLGPVSIDLVPGRITGVVGMNSSGKTTLLDIASGLLAPDSGIVEYPALEANPVRRRPIKARIGYVKQIPEAWSGTLRPNLNYTAAAFGITGNDNEALVDLFVNRYGLSDFQHKSWKSISGGYKTRFELVRTLVSRPDVLVLDEPLAYLDIVTQHIFLNDLRKIAQSQIKPMPILITSQHLYEVEAIADNMVILDNGKCLFSGRMETFRESVTQTVFEVSILAREREILEKLNPLGLIRIEPTSLGLILVFHPTDQPGKIRQALAQEFGEKLVYFRDISESTRRLFRNSREDFEPVAGMEGMQI